MASNYVRVIFTIPYKTLQRVERLAVIYGLSKANTLMKLVEAGLLAEGQKVEVSSVTSEGARDKNGIPIAVHNELREQL